MHVFIFPNKIIVFFRLSDIYIQYFRKNSSMRKLLNEELDRLNVEEFKSSEKIPVAIILDNIRSMNNIGSVFRTSDAFRIHSIALCGITAIPPNKEIHKTALGATDSVQWNYFKNTIQALEKYKGDGFIICSIEQVDNGIPLESFLINKEKKYALIFGNEVKGVDQNVVYKSDHCIEIPQFGTKHSLNISVSAGIVIWEFFRNFSSTINK